jgi:hypothetical protein
MLDKVDGFMSPMDLLRIAIDCGFDIDTRKFEEVKLPCEPKLEPVFFIRPEGTVPLADLTPEVLKQTVNIKPEPAKIKKSAGRPPKVVAKEPELDINIIPNGTKVSTFYDGEIIHGKITSNTVEDGEVTYSIDTDEGTITATEDDIEIG